MLSFLFKLIMDFKSFISPYVSGFCNKHAKVSSLGLEEFIRLVEEERSILPVDDRWTSYIDSLPSWGEIPIKTSSTLIESSFPEGFKLKLNHFSLELFHYFFVLLSSIFYLSNLYIIGIK